MDEATHKQWWPLHLRAALGETLSAEEQAVYDAGSKQLDEGEEQSLHGSVEALARSRQQNMELKAEYNRMHQEIQELEQQIALYEERLHTPAKQLLGVGR